jgi:hypothetical protein
LGEVGSEVSEGRRARSGSRRESRYDDPLLRILCRHSVDSLGRRADAGGRPATGGLVRVADA